MNERPSYRSAVNIGLILGLVCLTASIIIYFTGVENVISYKPTLILLAIVLPTMVYAATSRRKALGGFISFKEALGNIMVVFMINAVFLTTYNHILFNFLEPTLHEAVKEKSIAYSIEMMERFNVPEEEFDKRLEKMEAQDFTQTLGKSIEGLLYIIVIGLIPALIIALIVKRKNPEEVLE